MKNEEKVMEKGAKVDDRKVVEVEYGGTATWSINTPRTGKRVIYPGERAKFNMENKYEMRALIQILKQINLPKVNTQSFIQKGVAEPVKYRRRFSLVSGMENIPEALMKLSYRENDYYTPDEEKSILSLCPDFFEPEKKEGTR